MIEIKHHGATTGVTGSCHELSIESRHGGRHGILIDCGLFQGQEASGRASADDLAIDFSIEHLARWWSPMCTSIT
jgi:metallo-beta-lactamase family protein